MMPFVVQTTGHFDRSLRKLARKHPDLIEHYGQALDVLEVDP